MSSFPDPPLTGKRPRFSLRTVFFLFGVLFVNFFQSSGATIDGILAVVNDHLITQSDIRVQTLFSLEFPLLEKDEKETHLQFAIDQVLLLEDADKFATDKPTEQEIDDVWKKIESTAGSTGSLAFLLAEEGITKNELRDLISRFLLSKKFIDQRINFFIFISDNEIDSYYNDHQADWKGAPLEAVRNTVYSILYDQKRKAKLEEFLTKRRSKASIRITPPLFRGRAVKKGRASRLLADKLASAGCANLRLGCSRADLVEFIGDFSAPFASIVPEFLQFFAFNAVGHEISGGG